MKLKKTLIILIMLLIVTGCSHKINETEAVHISNKIIKYINGKYDKKGLSSKEKNIFDDFVNSTKVENYVVNLSEIYTFDFNPANKLDSSNNDFVYEEEGDYKIKYSNINWIPHEDTSYATITINGENRVLYKTYVPIINEETKNNDNYTYIYDFTNDKKDRIDVHYKSLNSTGGVVISYKKGNNKLKEIVVRFDPEYNYKKENNNSSRAINVVSVFIAIIIGGALIYGIVTLMKKF